MAVALMASPKTDLLSVGVIATLLGFSPRTVQRWMDSADLPSFPMPGRAAHRRAQFADVLNFARRSGFPTARLEDWAVTQGLSVSGCPPLLCVSLNAEIGLGLSRASFDVTIADDLIQCGQLLEGRTYRACVLDGSIGRASIVRLLFWLRQQRPAAVRAVIAEEDDDTRWDHHGAQVWGRRPLDLMGFADRVWKRL